MSLKEMPRHQWIGLVFFIAAFQFVIMLIVAETQYPGYNAGADYISGLGIWDHASAIIFNSSIIVFGALILIGTWLMQKEWSFPLVTVMFMLAGIGAIGVGIFNGTIQPAHSFFALLAFILGTLAVILIGRYLRPPMSYVSYALGLIGLTCLILFLGFGIDLWLGVGGMERMFVYPIFGWMMAFGGALMASKDVVSAKHR
jgi:hypothetical membrane protein